MPAESQAVVRPRSGRRSPRGFSLIELGIVIAVIAVLSGVVIGSAGYFRAARLRTAADLVLTIRGAARQFALRHHNGLSYGTSADPTVAGNLGLGALTSEGFLPKVQTPWESVNANQILVAPIGTPADSCAGFTCMQIEMPVPAEECDDMVKSLEKRTIVPPTCNGTTLTVVLR
ncbi:MAG: type IV pilin protein [Myxococcaceae bacterium]